MQKINQRSGNHHLAWPLILLILIAISACNLLASSTTLRETQVALAVQQTVLARTVIALTQPAFLTTQSGGLGETPQPPGLSPPLLSTPQTMAIKPEERLMKSAKILLFEDMSASRYVRFVKEALDQAGYSYIDVGSAKGWFKAQLLSPVEWDLVIAAAEARRDFGGEFFEYIEDRANRGTGVVIEAWDLDSAPMGRVKSLLDRCGVSVQNDWNDPDMRVFFWLIPEHPIFHEPNEIPSSLRNAPQLWKGDVGDLLTINQQNNQIIGDAVLLGGASTNSRNDHGTLATCLGGRMILQTFSSHEYQHDDMVPLWQNYIYQALKNHFAYTQTTSPTPAMTVLPSLNLTQPPSEQTPGPAYTFPYSCGGLMTAQLKEAPRIEKDLFEHHASGQFLILSLQLQNDSNFPFQIWDGDYFIEAQFEDRQIEYPIHQAATGYLYIDGGHNLYQDVIQPHQTWTTALAFDIDPSARDWIFVFKPGSEVGEQVCEVRIPLTR